MAGTHGPCECRTCGCPEALIDFGTGNNGAYGNAGIPTSTENWELVSEQVQYVQNAPDVPHLLWLQTVTRRRDLLLSVGADVVGTGSDAGGVKIAFYHSSNFVSFVIRGDQLVLFGDAGEVTAAFVAARPTRLTLTIRRDPLTGVMAYGETDQGDLLSAHLGTFSAESQNIQFGEILPLDAVIWLGITTAGNQPGLGAAQIFDNVSLRSCGPLGDSSGSSPSSSSGGIQTDCARCNGGRTASCVTVVFSAPLSYTTKCYWDEGTCGWTDGRNVACNGTQVIYSQGLSKIIFTDPTGDTSCTGMGAVFVVEGAEYQTATVEAGCDE